MTIIPTEEVENLLKFLGETKTTPGSPLIQEGIFKLASVVILDLRRIADSLEKLADSNRAVNKYGENLSDAIQNSIARGLNGLQS